MYYRFTLRHGLVLMTLATGALALAAGCNHTPNQPALAKPTTIAQNVAPNEFVGNAACIRCHTNIAEMHRKSRHALTLHTADRQSLGSLAPPTGRLPDTDYRFEKTGDGFALSGVWEEKSGSKLQLAFGSGKTGVTFAIVNGDTLSESRMSYFPRWHTWYITPGQEKLWNSEFGRVYSDDTARKCLLCHATALPAHSLVPEKRFFGVGCESCHGPGSAHIAALRAGKPANRQLETLGTWSATRLNRLCGQCHRTEEEVKATDQALDSTQRFQPYGLMLSRCFKESKDTLSCITCHNPHADAATDAKSYETTCLRCHASQPASPPNPGSGKPCPVNPREKCVGCHMPERRVFPDLDIPTKMADHFIRVYRKMPDGSSATLP